MKSLLFLAVPVLFAACAQPSLTGDTYSRGEAQSAQQVRYGKVTNVRFVTLEGSSTGGAILGAVAGGYLGRQVGSGSGRDAATIGGAALGGTAGSYAGQAANRRQGVEISVKLDGGGEVAIVQQADKDEPFYVGERVRVLGSGGRARVSH
ncbi:glycine zipper 2TM domain-containing protein [Haloferula sp. A504]|uniref:glycine zipper 2TM domain-containing protein n=1 Tax=Haloferula sp. A504 TaxID=3373601 RepID=UPI0031BDB7AA|nr:glycine zipper 2TM domain-containing protein [Verrucomicrobiaceae bacterium E54]